MSPRVMKNKKVKAKRTLARSLIPGSGRPSNPSQVRVQMTIQGPLTVVATQASTALLTLAYIAPSLSALTKLSSYAAVYDEWRLKRIKFHLVPCTLANGVTKFVMDDEDATSPTKSWMDSRRGVVLGNNSSDPKNHKTLVYRSEDLDDLEWQSCSTGSTYTPMALKMYTELSWGSPTSTNLWIVSWEGDFEFRGIGASA